MGNALAFVEMQHSLAVGCYPKPLAVGFYVPRNGADAPCGIILVVKFVEMVRPRVVDRETVACINPKEAVGVLLYILDIFSMITGPAKTDANE